jgi:hypothetical protein
LTTLMGGTFDRLAAFASALRKSDPALLGRSYPGAES